MLGYTAPKDVVGDRQGSRPTKLSSNTMASLLFMVSGIGLDVLKDSGKFPCSVCRSGVGRNSIECSSCGLWVHKRCSGITGRLASDPSYVCPRCRGLSRPIDGRPTSGIDVDGELLEVVPTFAYLGDNLSAGGGCDSAIAWRCCVAWGKFRKLLPVLTSKYVSPKIRGDVYSACVCSAMLHGGETWVPNVVDLQRLRRNDRSMIRMICRTKISDNVTSDQLLQKLGLCDIACVLQSRRLRWAGHVMRASTCIHNVTKIEVPGRKGRGRPKKTWAQCTKLDMRECGLTDVDPHDRLLWRKGTRLRLVPPTSAIGTRTAP